MLSGEGGGNCSGEQKRAQGQRSMGRSGSKEEDGKDASGFRGKRSELQECAQCVHKPTGISEGPKLKTNTQ